MASFQQDPICWMNPTSHEDIAQKLRASHFSVPVLVPPPFLWYILPTTLILANRPPLEPPVRYCSPQS